jgi:hypothetical protein
LEVTVTALALASRAVTEHGRKDFLAGAPCDPLIPLKIYEALTPEQRFVIVESWMNGWNDESAVNGTV